MKVQRQGEILSCLAVGIQHRQTYPPSVRNFCISLKNISPAGYRFLRKEFDDRIPTTGTIRAWHANPEIDAIPGILSQSLEILKRRASEKAIRNEKSIGTIIFDEMNIRKLLQWTDGRMLGYETLPGKDQKDAEIASQVIVFMFSALNDNLKVPIAYYFATHKLTSNEKHPLLNGVLKAVLECDAYLINITFDGCTTNSVICRMYGANLNVYSETFNPSFNFENCRINVVLDPSHAHKLVRGVIGTKKILYDAENNPIKWIYYERLVRFKDKRNYCLAHKMTQAHIDYASKPMKVKLAVETLSGKTANALEFLMEQGHSEFMGAEGTIHFNRIFDQIFDVFNSTLSSHTKENPLKRMMSRDNAPGIYALFATAIPYIKGLQFRNDRGVKVLLCGSASKTGFQGYIINMHSIMSIYEDLVVKKHLENCIAVHSLSQDHLEVFFGKIRSLNGYNNNPSCQQFNAAIRKLLANTTIHYSDEGNCTLMNPDTVYNPYSNISTITSRCSKKIDARQNQNFSEEEIEEVLRQLNEIQHSGPSQLEI